MKTGINYQVLFNSCLNYADDLMIVLSADLKILDINPQAQGYLRWQKSEVLGQSISQIFERTGVQPFVNQVEILKKESTISFINHYDQVLKISWDIIPIDDAADRYVLLVGRKSMLPNYELLEDLQLENVLNYAPGLFYWKDTNSVYRGCNDEFARLAGLESRAHVKGKTDYEMSWKDRGDLYRAVDQQVIKSGIPVLNYEDVFKLSDGKPMIAITNKVPLWSTKGEVIGLLGITVDISRQKEVELALKIAKEQAEIANQAKTEFISNISHDIRNPLTGVVDMAKLLEVQVSNEKHKQFARWLGESSSQLLDMLNTVLDLVSLDYAAEEKIHTQSFDIRALVQGIIDLEKPSAVMKGIDLVRHIDDNIPRFLKADAVKLHRILLNLLGNAIKFTDQGYVDIRIILLSNTKDSCRLQCQVIDTGIGISKALQDKVFEQFFRVIPSRLGVHEGHGVGLHIAQSYAQLMGSVIKIKSELDQGTMFYFDLDLAKSDADAISLDHALTEDLPIKASQSSIKTSQKPLHVLLVEDNKIALFMLESLVTQAGYHFSSARDGVTALEMAQKQSFDLLITDLGLPKLSGLDLTRALRADIHGLNRSIPIFGLTAHPNFKINAECLDAGMNKAFTKPMSAAILDSIRLNYFSSIQALNTETKQPAQVQSGFLGDDLPQSEAALFELDHLPLLDIAQALRGIGQDKELLTSILVAMVEQELPQDLEELYRLHAKSDWDGIEHLAHRMKGGLMYCGTEKLVLACQYLERYRKAGHSKLLEALYQQVSQIAGKTLTVMKTWLAQEVEEEDVRV